MRDQRVIVSIIQNNVYTLCGSVGSKLGEERNRAKSPSVISQNQVLATYSGPVLIAPRLILQ